MRACRGGPQPNRQEETSLSYPQLYLGILGNDNGGTPDTDSLCVTESWEHGDTRYWCWQLILLPVRVIDRVP